MARLRELQQIDLQLDELEQEKKAILDRIDENKGFLNKLVEDLDTQKSELTEIRKLQRQKKDDLAEERERHDQRRKRLHNVGSTKEFNAVETEIAALKKTIEQTEEELLHLGEVIETTEASIEEKEEKIDQLRESIAQEEAGAETELSELDAKIKALNDREDKRRDEVSKRVLYKYDFIRERRPGESAIAAAKDSHCESCFMAVPPQMYIEIQRGETLVTCPSCQRILYFWEDAIGEGEIEVETD
ncbi:MAG: C4-type zinc ribbon domain-containing protein [Thermoanaerobaculia bacterium]|nr:C4-type zinc ribbon domain-containing protein [Thermoanaerobaculia bacterium]